jgi:hypothetical protein
MNILNYISSDIILVLSDNNQISKLSKSKKNNLFRYMCHRNGIHTVKHLLKDNDVDPGCYGNQALRNACRN